MDLDSKKESNQRIQLVDALRGFALLGIVLIHFVEHFELFREPSINFYFSAETNKNVFDFVFALISGKAYSIFALMFGFSFFIQLHNRELKGDDFRFIFARRLIILFIFGIIHSFIYRGDILHIYALLGLFLIPFYKVSNKYLLVLAFLFVVQIPLIYHLIQTVINEDYSYVRDWGGNFFAHGNEVYATGSFLDVLKVNLWEGRYIVWSWTYYTGRFVQLFGLFLIGLYLGKVGFFKNPLKFKTAIIKWIIACIFIVIALNYLKSRFVVFDFSGTQKMLINDLLKSYLNLAFTFIIVGLFTLSILYLKVSYIINSLAVYGRMSLTNYVTQAVFGVILFYGFGFGMYNYLGAAWSLLAGISFFILQVRFSKYWLNNHYYGPLEWLWRALTFKDFNLKFKK